MQITINISDFYLDEDKELEPALKSHIISDAVYQINASIKKQVDALVDDIIKKEIHQELSIRVKVFVDEFVKSGKVKESYGDKIMTVSEWISTAIKNNSTNLTDSIKNAAELAVKNLKNQYDLLFATQIVTKIKEAGYLKDEVAKILLSDKTE